MREKILIDAWDEVKEIINKEGTFSAITNELIEELKSKFAIKALSDYASAPKEKYSKDEVLSAFKKVFDFDEAFTDNELGYIKTVMDTYAAQFQSLSSAPESGGEQAKCTSDPNTCEVAFCGWPHKCDTPPTKESGGDV